MIKEIKFTDGYRFISIEPSALSLDIDFELNLSGVHGQSSDCLNSGIFEFLYVGLHNCGQS